MYDAYKNNSPADTEVNEGIPIVYPSDPKNTNVLRFTDEGVDRPLQPLDETTSRVLEEHGCSTSPY